MEQMEFLDAVLTENPVTGNKNSWLGAKDTGHDGTWKWTHTGWMVEDWIWAVGEQFMYMKNYSSLNYDTMCTRCVQNWDRKELHGIFELFREWTKRRCGCKLY